MKKLVLPTLVILLFTVSSLSTSVESHAYGGTPDTCCLRNGIPACPPARNVLALHDGKFWDGKGCLKGTTRQDLRNTFDHLINTDSNLVIFAHGGLVGRKSAYATPYTRGLDTTFRNANGFPLYVMYGCGVKEAFMIMGARILGYDPDDKFELDEEMPTGETTLEQQMVQLDNLESFLYLAEQLNENYTSYDATEKGLGKNYQPISDTTLVHLKYLDEINQAEDNYYADFEENAGGSNKSMRELEKSDAEFINQLQEDTRLQELCVKDFGLDTTVNPKSLTWNPVKTVYNVYQICRGIRERFKSGRNHQIHNTIVEEILYQTRFSFFSGLKQLAVSGWKAVKDAAENPFLPGKEFGGYQLLNEIARMDSVDALRNFKRKIVICGSSTGVIFINKLLQTASSNPKFSHLQFNVIYSVPACSYHDMKTTFSSSMHMIKSFSCFGLSDETENSCGWDPAYPGSILYFISSIAEAYPNRDLPIFGMQRFWEMEDADYDAMMPEEKKDLLFVRDVFRKNREFKMVWSCTKCDGPSTVYCNTGTKHTNVLDNSFTLRSIASILRKP